jgi:hypothetical protein
VAFLDLDGDVIDRLKLAEALAEIGDVDGEGHGNGSTSTGRPGWRVSGWGG